MRKPGVPEMRLRFRVSEVPYWAARYAYEDDTGVIAIGEAARRAGFYTRAQFLAVAEWKTERSKGRCRLNDEASVREVTGAALSARDERLRVGALTLLEGVGVPTASVLLHLAHPDPYPILDFRALWSLGVDRQPPYYPFALWWAYTSACRSLAEEAGVPMRTLDRALWQYSAENQPSSGA